MLFQLLSNFGTLLCVSRLAKNKIHYYIYIHIENLLCWKMKNVDKNEKLVLPTPHRNSKNNCIQCKFKVQTT